MPLWNKDPRIRNYPVQWSIADTLLKRIDDEGLQKDIDRIAGNEFLENIRAQHAIYGKMVKGMLQKEEALASDLGDHVRTMGAIIVDYSTKVLATMDHDDPDTFGPVRTALRPIDAYREAAARRAKGGGAEEQDPKKPEEK